MTPHKTDLTHAVIVGDNGNDRWTELRDEDDDALPGGLPEAHDINRSFRVLCQGCVDPVT